MTGDELREAAIRVDRASGGDLSLNVTGLRDLIKKTAMALDAKDDELNTLRERYVPPEWFVPGGGPAMLHREDDREVHRYRRMSAPFGHRQDDEFGRTWLADVEDDNGCHRGEGRTAAEALSNAEAAAEAAKE